MQLRIEGISKSYGKNRALVDFSLVMEPGIYALLGPNGSGKSTLMNILTDNLKADCGSITYRDGEETPRDVLKMGSEFREKLGYMPQYPGMYANFSIESFLWYMATLKNMGAELKGRQRRAYIADRIAEILSAVELLEVSHRKIRALSGGMRQRLALAQALLGDPDILILDEPTAGLDPKQRISIRNLISRVALDKIVLIATHVVSDVEYIAKKAIILKAGSIVDFASPAELAAQIEGKVWQIAAEDGEVAALQSEYRVTNLSRSEETGKVMLRVLSDTKPHETALPLPPTLEDYYLYVFQNETLTG